MRAGFSYNRRTDYYVASYHMTVITKFGCYLIPVYYVAIYDSCGCYLIPVYYVAIYDSCLFTYAKCCQFFFQICQTLSNFKILANVVQKLSKDIVPSVGMIYVENDDKNTKPNQNDVKITKGKYIL
uniref:Uncharacterized protein n=1 Tax=Arundo donax TaxID=35708 RepID=A0A0A8Z6Q2_ARUDO